MNTRLAAIYSIIDVIEKNRDLQSSIKKHNAKLNVNESCAFLVSGVLKNKFLLDFLIYKILSKPLKTLDYKVRSVLRLAYFELEFTDNPDFAVVNSYVELIKKLNPKASGLVNAGLRKYQRERDAVEIPSKADSADLSVKYSHPKWMIDNWLKEYGENATVEILKYNNSAAKLTLRLNLLKINMEQFLKMLDNSGIEYIKSKVPDCINVVFKGSPTLIPGYKEGYWVIQGESSALVAHVLNPKENEDILDVCAAPGGKSTHIASLCLDKARITALDVSKNRIEKINDNIKRLNLSSIKTLVADACSVSFDKCFDKILIDAPCSNTGVLNKRADARWNRKQEDVLELSKIQSSILNNISKYLKVGGSLVYSTCSIEYVENQGLIDNFLSLNKNFQLQPLQEFVPFDIPNNGGCLQVLPFKHEMDGFYIAKLTRIY